MVGDPRDKDKARAASYFMARAEEAVAAADEARSEDAMAALYKEAETWLYMASQCLNPDAIAPPSRGLNLTHRVGGERRSFSRDD
jgi:hypothetical protein